MDKMRMESVDVTANNIEKIEKLFPNCITEKKDEDGTLKKAINFELLKQMLSDDVIEGDEAYEFTWVGKKASIVEANRPIRKTLLPCPKESVNWDTTENLYIEGDNLEVLKLLQESYLGKVKMIYIDPPYNTGNDFVYADDFRVASDDWELYSGSLDDEGNRLFKNTETNGRFHSDWCSMLYARLLLARNLLTDDGALFVSIDDHEIDNAIKICSEIFGEENHIATLIWQQRKGGGNDSRFVAVDHEYILVFAKMQNLIEKKWRIAQSEEYLTRYKEIEPDGRRYYWDTLVRNGLQSPIPVTLQTPDGEWIKINSQWSQKRVEEGLMNGTVKFSKTASGWSLHHKVYMKDGQVLRSLLTNYGNNRSAGQDIVSLFDDVIFDYSKPASLIQILLQLCTENDDIILDFFSGSSTTAHAVIQQNLEDNCARKFIMIQLPEKCKPDSKAYKAGFNDICSIGKERIRRAGAKITGETSQEIDVGFRVFKLADSNMNDVYYSAGEYTQNMLTSLESNVKSNRNDLDLLFGCLLEWGLPLSLPYYSETIDSYTIHTYNNGDLVACFDENIPDAVIKEIARRQPLRAVFRDRSFNGSPAKINVGEIFKMLAPDTRVKVI